MINGYIVTMRVFIEAPTEVEATDGVGEILRRVEQDDESMVFDWEIHGKLIPLGVRDEFFSEESNEGVVFDMIDKAQDGQKVGIGNYQLFENIAAISADVHANDG